MNTKITQALSLLFLLGFTCTLVSQTKLPTPHTESILYLGSGEEQPLVVGLGGSEGGNAWASNFWKSTRDQFIAKGYAFLAIGYFGCETSPKLLDRIELPDIHAAIVMAAGNKQINKNKIVLIGGSRGADLALLLASYYDDISCVVGMSPSHAVFPGHTQELNTSCWTYQEKELPFVPVNEEAVPFLMKHDLRGAFTAMLKDTAAEKRALIPVERMQCPVLLLSATKDEMIPAVEMCEKMMSTWRSVHFKYPYEHLVLEGTHTETTRHFDTIFQFLDRHFLR